MKHGFTLIELMIVVAIIGILAATAVPLYTAYVNEASKAEVNTILPDLAAKEEVYFNTWDRYIFIDMPDLPSNGSRTIQSPANKNEQKDWEDLGFQPTDSGGIFGGPVYYKYGIVDAKGYTILAARDLGGDVIETGLISRENKRAVLFSQGSEVKNPKKDSAKKDAAGGGSPVP